MTNDERSGWRDEWMSRWHRTLGPDYPMHDIDSVEWRFGRPVALIEWKYALRYFSVQDSQKHFEKTSLWTLERLSMLGQMLEVDAFLIQYDRQGWFRLWKFADNSLHAIGELNEQQMRLWHMALGNGSSFQIPEKEHIIIGGLLMKKTCTRKKAPDACRENGRPTKQLPLSGFYNEEVRS